MLLPQIRCYHSSIDDQPFTFFILSKGENAGKPALVPWSNCFSIRCNNQESFDFHFWLVYAVFKSEKFKTRHRGSVILFVSLQDIRDVLKEYTPVVFSHWRQFQSIMQAMDLLQKSKTTLGQQLITTEKMQNYLINHFFKTYQ